MKRLTSRRAVLRGTLATALATRLRPKPAQASVPALSLPIGPSGQVLGDGFVIRHGYATENTWRTPGTNAFMQGAPMSAGRGRGAGGVAVYGGKIYYAGGLHNGEAVAWFDVYDPATNSWTQLLDMPRARDHFHGAVVGGKFYVIGGRATHIGATTTANDAFDFAAGTWQTGLAPLPTARSGFAAAVLDGEILIIGGEGGGTAFNKVEAYDAATDTWRTLAPLPTARHGIQAAVCNGGIYVAAGGTAQGGGSPSNVHEVFFLNGPTACSSSGATSTPVITPTPTLTPRGTPGEAGAWQTLTPSGFNRQEVAYVQVGGKFYLAGGSTGHEVYDPSTNTWTSVTPLPANLDHIQGVVLNGLIYYIGGLAGSLRSQVDTVYVYNPGRLAT